MKVVEVKEVIDLNLNFQDVVDTPFEAARHNVKQIKLLNKQLFQNSDITCLFCDKTLSRIDRLTYHVQQVHGKDFERKIRGTNQNCEFICSFCPKVCTSATNIRKHERRMHGPKQEFVCPVCNKMFCRKETLEMHLTKKHFPPI